MNRDAAKIFSKVVLSEKKIRIKLLGDSITHGVGGTGFKQSGGVIVDGYARNPDGYCWANEFKEYMESEFNCEIINNACTGTNIEFIINNFEKLVSKDDDIVLCTIGTNNRHQYFKDAPKRSKEEHMTRFYNNIVKLGNIFKEKNIDFVFVANIPAAQANECDGEDYWRLFYMKDVNRMYLKASAEEGFPVISLYSLFVDYCESNGITVDSLLCDGLHPNNEGHRVMFKLLVKEIGVIL